MPFVSALRTVLRLTGVALIATLSPALLAQSGSAAADGFDPNFNGGSPSVYAVAVQPDGKILVAGEFTGLQPNGATSQTGRNRLARLNVDGTPDSSFHPDIDGQINAMALQPDGRIVIGGQFTAVNGTTRKHVARLNADGSLDPSFDPNTGDMAPPPNGSLTPEVTAIALQPDGKILIGGGFVTLQPNGGEVVSRKRIARLNADGTLDATFAPQFNNTVLAIAVQADGKIVVGGGFTVPTATDSPYLRRNHVARLNADGTLDAGFDPNLNGSVNAIVVQDDGKILLGGGFNTVQPNGTDTAATKTNLLRLNADGTLDSTFFGTADGTVYALLRQPDGRVIAAGSFGVVGGQVIPYVGRLLPDGSADLSFFVQPNFSVYALALQSDGSVVLGGGFTALRGNGNGSVARNHLARVSPAGALDANFRPDANGRLRTVALQGDGKVLVGGTFTSVGGQTHNGLARLDPSGAIDSSFNANVAGSVATIVPLSGGKILIGGSISRVNGVSRQNIAQVNADGTLDANFKTNTNGQVSAIAVQSDGKILIGGSFTAVSSAGDATQTARNYIARLNADGTLDTGFTAAMSDVVSAIAIQGDGKILIAGSFTTVLPSGTSATTANRFHLVRLNADGTLDTDFNAGLDGSAFSIAVQGDGKIVLAGQFQQVAGSKAVTSVARSNLVRLNADGTIDDAFSPQVEGAILDAVVQGDGKILIGGVFDKVTPNGGTSYSHNYIARLNADGTVDTGFDVTLDTLPGNRVGAFAVSGDGTILVAGSFTSVQHGTDAPVLISRLVRLKADSTIDPSFNSDMGSASGAPIEAIAGQLSGRLLAAGSFGNLSGTQTSGIAMFFADGTPDTTFVPNVNGPVHTVAQLPSSSAPINTQTTGFAWLTTSGGLRSDVALAADTKLAALTVLKVQPDGKILAAGGVGTGGAAYNMLRLNPDGSLDTSFHPLVTNGTVLCLALQSDGKIVIGGTFTTVSDTGRAYLARLNADGTLDTSFSANPNSNVNAIAIQSDGKIVIGGAFTTVQPDTTQSAIRRNHIARLNADGSADTGFDPNASDMVLAILLQSDGKILIGGNFTQFAPNNATTATTRFYIARLNADGTLDSFDLAPNGNVGVLLPDSSGNIIVAGGFTFIGGKARNYIARLKSDGTIDDGFNPNPNSTVLAAAQQSDGKIVIGGTFTALQPNSSGYDSTVATPRSYMARLNTDGTVDPTFNPNFDNTVGVLTVYNDGSVMAGGLFATLQPAGSLVVGGSFNSVNGLSGVSNLAVFSTNGSISSTFQPNPNGDVYALLPLADGGLVVGGAFTTISGVTRNHIARYLADTSLDPSFDPNANGTVYAVAVDSSGRFLLGGSFTSVGGGTHNYIARFNANGTVDGAFNPAVSGAVHAILVQPDGHLLVLADGTGGVQSVLARYDAAGALDGTFTAVNGGTAPINAIALQTDGKIVVGGGFTSIAGGARSYIARLNPDGSLDPTVTATPNGPVTTVTVQPDGKIVFAGMFSAVDGLPRFGIARLAPTQTPVSAFTLSADRANATWLRSGTGPEIYGAVVEISTDGRTWNDFGRATRIAGTTNWQIGGLNSSASGDLYLRFRGLVASTPNSSSGMVEGYTHFALVPTPVITSATVVGSPVNTSFYYQILATGATGYDVSGLPAGLSFNSATGVISGTPTQQGNYQVIVTAKNANGPTTMNLLLIVGAPAGPHAEGSVTDAGSNIRHPNGNTIDQYLLTGTSATLRADPGEVVRVSYIDLDDDIVQVEFSGAGRFTISLAGSSGPAAPVKYNQPGVAYMKGHATIAVVGADETTNLSVFSVGKANAINQSLFPAGTEYDGIADIAAISIASTNSRFGGLRCANVFFFSDTGTTGVDAPGVQFAGPVYIGDISAFDTASASLVIGSCADRTLITGGDLQQANNTAVKVAGLTRLEFVAGATSGGDVLPAQTNKSTLMQDGVDITSTIVVNP